MADVFQIFYAAPDHRKKEEVELEGFIFHRVVPANILPGVSLRRSDGSDMERPWERNPSRIALAGEPIAGGVGFTIESVGRANAFPTEAI